METSVKPALDKGLTTVIGYGQALFGVVSGNKEWIKSGLTAAGQAPQAGADQDGWVTSWADGVAEKAATISKFVGYSLLTAGMISGNFPIAVAGIVLAGVPSFVAEGGDRSWIKKKALEIIETTAKLKIVAGSLMMIGGIVANNPKLAAAGGVTAALGISTVVLGRIDWMTADLDELIGKAEDLGKVAGWMMLIVGAHRGNWKLASAGATQVAIAASFGGGDEGWWTKLLPGEEHMTYLENLALTYATVAAWKAVMSSGKGWASPVLPIAIGLTGAAGFSWARHLGLGGSDHPLAPIGIEEDPDWGEGPEKEIDLTPIGGPHTAGDSKLEEPPKTPPSDIGDAAEEGQEKAEELGYGMHRQLWQPQSATGAIVTRPTWSLIGEAGPEAVVPLNTMPGASPLNSGGANITVNIIAEGGQINDPDWLADRIEYAIRERRKTEGGFGMREALGVA